jgi:hypothetical protein
VGFCRACAPVRCAHPSFGTHCHAKRALRAPPRPSQLRCFLFDPQKYIKSLELGPFTWRVFFCPLDRRGYEVPCPRPTHRSFADPSGNVLGSKVYTDATIRTNFFGFFSSVFRSFPFVILFFFFSPFQFLLILLFLSLLILLVGLFFVFLFFYSYILNCLSYYRHAY